MTIVTFTNLFPSSVMPTLGTFVFERMRRVAAASGLDWRVVAPVPEVSWLLRHGVYQRWRQVPQEERWQDVQVAHPRYRHWPGCSLRRQADAMAKGARAAVQALAQQGPIVIDAHYVWPDGVAAAILASELRVPFSITARGTDVNVVGKDPVVASRIAEIAPRALGLFAVSDALCERFAAVAGVPRDRIVQVRNGVDLDRFKPGDAAAARTDLGLPQGDRLLLGVGRLVQAKGFTVAARALAKLPADVRLVLVGDGNERGKIAAIGAALGGALGGNRVILLGERPPAEVAKCYQACDLLVLPSSREGWPNVVTEALASGLRVVATSVGGIPEILADPVPGVGPLGMLVEPSNEGGNDAAFDATFAAAVAATLAVPGNRAGVRAFAERYGWQAPIAFLSDLFQRALGATVA